MTPWGRFISYPHGEVVPMEQPTFLAYKDALFSELLTNVRIDPAYRFPVLYILNFGIKVLL